MNNRVRTDTGHRVVPETTEPIIEAWAPSRSRGSNAGARLTHVPGIVYAVDTLLSATAEDRALV